MFKLDMRNIFIGAVLFSILWFFNYVLGAFLLTAAACIIGIYVFNAIGSVVRKGAKSDKKDEPEPFEDKSHK